MRIAELIAPHRFRLAEGQVAEPGPGEVQVHVECIGICGSDLHSYSEGAVGAVPTRFPVVLGHEPAGTVVKTGPGVTGWAAGDRAAFEPAIYCYHCEFCRTGHHNVCDNLRFLSAAGEPGFFREYVNLPAVSLLPIAPTLSTRDATMVEPLSVVLHSMKWVALQTGETAVVFGAGPIGLFTVICLKLSGARRVWAVEPVAHRREMALAAGADAALDPAADPVAEILRDTRGRGADVAVDCAAQGNTINQCIHVVRKAGRVVITAIPSGAVFPIEFTPMRGKEVTLYNVRRANHDSEMALELLYAHLPRFAAMITHTRPLECIGEAFAIAERYSDGAGKIIITT